MTEGKTGSCDHRDTPTCGLKQCQICGVPTYAINVHHVSYSPEVTIEICANCHFIIHHPPDRIEKMVVLSEKLQHYIMLNYERKEAEQQVQIQTEKLARINAQIELDWKYRFKRGFDTYECKRAKTEQEIIKLGEQGFELVTRDSIDGTHIFRRPSKLARETLPFWIFFPREEEPEHG